MRRGARAVAHGTHQGAPAVARTPPLSVSTHCARVAARAGVSRATLSQQRITRRMRRALRARARRTAAHKRLRCISHIRFMTTNGAVSGCFKVSSSHSASECTAGRRACGDHGRRDEHDVDGRRSVYQVRHLHHQGEWWGGYRGCVEHGRRARPRITISSRTHNAPTHAQNA